MKVSKKFEKRIQRKKVKTIFTNWATAWVLLRPWVNNAPYEGGDTLSGGGDATSSITNIITIVMEIDYHLFSSSFLLALAEGLEHSSLLLTLGKNSASRGANEALIVRLYP